MKITHPDKVLFPKGRITKQDIADYYASVSSLILPHLRNRPISMKRYPSGIEGEGFFQKNVPKGMPSFIKIVKVKRREGGSMEMVLCNDKKNLLWIANQNCIGIHIPLAKIDKPNHPDRMVFDLDPPKGKKFSSVIQGALTLREKLAKHRFKSHVMTTGSKGLHVVVFLRRTKTYVEIREFAREIAEELVSEEPKKYTTAARTEKRGGKLYLDVMRNSYGATAVAPYSVRPKDGAPIATPITWEELKKTGLRSDSFTIKNSEKRTMKVW